MSTGSSELINRARNYISKIPGAISGEGGHNRTFHVSCLLVHKFELDEQEAMELLLEFNERCEPPWSEEELDHKLNDALNSADNPPTKPEQQAPKPKLFRPSPRRERPPKPHLPNIRPFTWDDTVALARLRNIPPDGINLVVKRGFLFKVDWHETDCFGVRDRSGMLLELRRMDGQSFPAVPDHGLSERKSHTVKHSQKSWPLGAVEAFDFDCVALVETCRRGGNAVRALGNW